MIPKPTHKISRHLPVLATALAVAVLMGQAAAAVVQPSPPKPVRSANSEAVARLTLAAQLAEDGRRTGSPMALAAAAEIMSSTAVRDRDAAKSSEGGAAATGEGEPASRGATEPASGGDEASALGTGAELFAEAAAIARAASDEALASQIELSAAAAGTRQPSPGHGGRHRDRVSPNTTDVYTVRYNANELARATLIAGGNFDLDLYVYDPAGTLAAYDNDSTSIGICVWTPSNTGDYKIRVKNTTSHFVNYLIFTN
jgi:hypothetical protein